MLTRGAMVSLPTLWARRLGGALGKAAFYLLGGERRKVLDNLKLAYGDSLSDGARRDIARSVFQNAGRSVAEGALLSVGRMRTIMSDVRVDGFEHIQAVLDSGRGVVLLSAHMGNWEMITAALTPKLSCEMGGVARKLHNPYMERIIAETRRRIGSRVFSRGKTGRDYVRFLKEGNLLAIMGDIDTLKGEGVFVDFFGRPAWTQIGIARLARIGKARIVPAFMLRDRRDPARHVLEIGPPLEESEGLDGPAWIQAMTATFTAEIERAVRARPDLWMWMHRRWRRQPGDPKLRARKSGANPGKSRQSEEAQC